MKRILVLCLSLLVLVSFVACSKDTVKETENEEQKAAVVEITDATELLTTVWGTYAEEDQFAIMGGDYTTYVDNAPGKFDISNVADLDAILGVPSDAVAMIDDVASMVHMMNANTFTAGAYHMTDDADMQAFADALKENIMNRQWMCGFPDTLIIVSVGDEYVVSAFGAADVIETFKTNLSA